MPNTVVSLIIVNYNAGDFLEVCVSSVLSHVDELIVVDNASTDASLAKLEQALPANSIVKIPKTFQCSPIPKTAFDPPPS